MTMMFGNYGNHMGGWAWLGMSVGLILIWGLVLTVVVLLVRTHGSGRNPPR